MAHTFDWDGQRHMLKDAAKPHFLKEPMMVTAPLPPSLTQLKFFEHLHEQSARQKERVSGVSLPSWYVNR